MEGVILMRVGEQAQVILRRVEAMTRELNEHVLPPDVKVVPYYDRQGLIEETTKTVEANLLRGMVLVLIILGLFLFSVRTALIVAVTIPFALMFSFICLDWRTSPPICCPSAPSTSASSWMDRWSWWRTSSANWRPAMATKTTTLST